jgi:alkanesulfonate monooxygenase SsuD/methylene tetrahydromethanopterin reductase-like flavin-dependent oxidoreductase (luciferase family)
MTPMKFGLTIPYLDARKSAELAKIGEDAGWDGAFLGDAIWCQDPMICLAAMAMTTGHIRLGMMVIPVPLRKPWKIASESVALDHLSGGRVTLGLGMGAVWMGWQGFPDEVTGTRERAEMLDETIDILTALYQCEPFDFDGKHYHLKLTLVDAMHYPPKPVQQPRIPLWAVGVWPRKQSMRRTLKCDGLLPMKMNGEGKFEELTPEDVREIRAFVDSERGSQQPFDIVVEGKSFGLSVVEKAEKIAAWSDAGATWWIEGLWGESEERVQEVIRRGPPK